MPNVEPPQSLDEVFETKTARRLCEVIHSASASATRIDRARVLSPYAYSAEVEASPYTRTDKLPPLCGRFDALEFSSVSHPSEQRASL